MPRRSVGGKEGRSFWAWGEGISVNHQVKPECKVQSEGRLEMCMIIIIKFQQSIVSLSERAKVNPGLSHNWVVTKDKAAKSRFYRQRVWQGD